MNRIKNRTESSDLISMFIMLYSLPRVIERINAITVLPGLGETWRLTDALKAWENKDYVAKYLLITGHNKREKTWKHLTLYNINIKRQKGVYIESHAEHTKEQAEWLFEKVKDLKITSLAIYVSPYHLLRAYCTILKTFINHKSSPIPMIPIPVAISPDAIIPEINTDAWNMVSGEVDRIIKYQKKGDVATYDEFKYYLSWLWKQSIVYI
jgi:hypothetical protein